MERNYEVYNPEIAESLIDADNAIDKAVYELRELYNRKTKAKNDPEALKNIDEIIRYKEAELTRFRKDREDIERGYG